ncbi:MAG: hypothetical protein ACPGXY_03920, partial [Alphaproteobacteria bacterium]
MKKRFLIAPIIVLSVALGADRWLSIKRAEVSSAIQQAQTDLTALNHRFRDVSYYNSTQAYWRNTCQRLQCDVQRLQASELIKDISSHYRLSNISYKFYQPTQNQGLVKTPLEIRFQVKSDRD